MIRSFRPAVNLLLAFGLAATISSAAAGTLSDDFNTSHDYSGGNVSGTIWSGLLNAGNASTANANDSNAGQLTLAVPGNDSGFDASHNNAPFLYVDITGDFTAQVQIIDVTLTNFSVAALMARGTPTTTGGTNNGENFVSMNYNGFAPFDAGRNLVAGTETNVNSANDPFLELIRSGNTFTLLTSSDGTTYTERDVFTNPNLGPTLQVGLYYGTYSGNSGVGRFDNFSVSGPNVVPEPSTWALLGLGGLALGWRSVQRRRRAS